MMRRGKILLLLLLSIFLLSDAGFAFGAKGDGMNGKGGMTTDERPREMKEEKAMHEGTTMKDGGMKAGEMKKDEMMQDEEAMKATDMKKDGGMKSKDTMK